MNKKQLIVSLSMATLLFSIVPRAFAYFENYPPYKFKEGAPKHLEAQPLVDIDRVELKYIANKKNDESLLDVYWVDLDGNGLKDFIIFSSDRGSGLAGYEIKVEILLNKNDGTYNKINYLTMAGDPEEEFVDLNRDGKYEVIITDMYSGDKHNYFSYDIYEFKEYKLVNADAKFSGFPKFVWITNNPNDKDTVHLAKDQRMAHIRQKDNSIAYSEIGKVKTIMNRRVAPELELKHEDFTRKSYESALSLIKEVLSEYEKGKPYDPHLERNYIGISNSLLRLQGYSLIAEEELSQLKLENAKLKKADSKEMQKLEKSLKEIRQAIDKFLRENIWVD